MWKNKLIIGLENVSIIILPLLCVFSYTFAIPFIAFYASRRLIQEKFKITNIINAKHSLPIILVYCIVIICSIFTNIESYNYILLYLILIFSFTLTFKINSDQYHCIEIGNYIACIISVVATIYNEKYLFSNNQYHILLILLYSLATKNWYYRFLIISIISIYILSHGNILDSDVLHVSLFVIIYNLLFVKYKILSGKLIIPLYFSIMISSMISYKYHNPGIYRDISLNLINGNGIMKYGALQNIRPNAFMEILYDYGAISYSLFCIIIFSFIARISHRNQQKSFIGNIKDNDAIVHSYILIIIFYMCKCLSIYDINQVMGIFCITTLLRSYK